MILLSGGSKSRHRGAGLIRNLLFSPETRQPVAQVPGLAKALAKLQKTVDGETQQRASLAFNMLQQEQGTDDVSILERRLMNTDNKTTNGVQETHTKAQLAVLPAQAQNRMPPTPPEETSMDVKFQADLFSPIQPVDDASLNLLSSAPNRERLAHHRVAGSPAQASPPQHQHPSPQRDVCGPGQAISCILTSSDPVQILDAIQGLRASLQQEPGFRSQDEIGQDTRLFPLIGRLLNEDARRGKWDRRSGEKCQHYNMDREILSLLRDLCLNHSTNVARLCRHDSILSAILRFSLRMAGYEAGTEALIAAELLSFCMVDDDNFDRLASVRASWKRALTHGKAAPVPWNDSTRRQYGHSPRTKGSPGTQSVLHSANYVARQAIISREWSA